MFLLFVQITHTQTCTSVFEVTGKLPVNKDLKVQVWDKDLTSSDDLIGETIIDLENRYLTRHRATVGLAKQYHV